MSLKVSIENAECNAALPLGLVMLKKQTALRLGLNVPTIQRGYKQGEFSVAVKASEFGDRIQITGAQGFLIAHVGIDTIDYHKKFFNLHSGQEITVKRDSVDITQPDPTIRVRGIRLFDDGRYSIIYTGGEVFDDPASHDYRLTPVGTGLLAEPETSSGIDAKLKRGADLRFQLNQAVETEQWFSAIELSVTAPESLIYRSLLFSGSTFWAPFACRPRAYGSFYKTSGDDTGLTVAHGKLGADSFGSVITLDTVTSDNFSDSIPTVKRVYFNPIVSPDDPAPPVRRYVETEGDGALAGIATVPGTSNLLAVRGMEYDYSGATFVNPFTAETYSVDGVTLVVDGEDYHRAATPGNDVWMTSGYHVSGRARYSDGSGRILTSGYLTIANDLKLPYGVSPRGLTYLHMQKGGEFKHHRTALVCAGTIIEETCPELEEAITDENSVALTPTLILYADRDLTGTISFENGSDVVWGEGTTFLTDYVAGDFIQYGTTIKYIETITADDSLNLVEPFSGTSIAGVQHLRIGEDGYLPLLIRPTNFRVIHVHHGTKFDAVVYAKTEYVSHEEILLPYRKNRTYPSAAAGNKFQMAQCEVTTITTFWVSVNGVKTQLMESTDVPLRCTVRENILLARSQVLQGDEFTPIATADPVHIRNVQLNGGFQGHPWSNVGYKTEWQEGAPGIAELQVNLVAEEAAANCTVTRVFTSEARDFFLGFDVFPQQWHHELQFITDNPTEIPDFPETNFLGAQFQEALFPPTCDSLNVAPKSRQWLVFSQGGNLIRRITPPADNRVNGVALVQ